MMSKNWVRYLALLLAAGLFTTSLSACNTMKGFGEDMEAAGEAIQDGSDEEE